ncbi:zinc finger BED domain-containing protein DAYSLEEPER-like isoform X3 [Andrographis paniculata]|uniref:zinc finger BED domain-containing protein DAYSLEEPER-like isoform X3 n=1 Tax=Andrographis paniculata TaxID=175694 RepID=UPI0021E6EE17|nr:zinc finger BED domain-containing protein DAYSLEEPER-like isoform X3 [Andrographis paniculata]
MCPMDGSDKNGLPNSGAQSNKPRRRKSLVWEHFTIETVNADCMRACCNQCKKSFSYISGAKISGTSHLKRHITLGICPVYRHRQVAEGSGPLMMSARRAETSGSRTKVRRKRPHAFNGDSCCHELAMMIIMHDYPLHMVEHLGFRDFALALQPQFNITSIAAVEEEIMRIYFREKQRVLDVLNEVSGCLNLIVDLWTSDQSSAYAVLTGHFVDENWKLQRRIMNVVTLHYPESDTAYCHAIAYCLNDWCSEGKLFAFALDRSFANETTREITRYILSLRSPFILSGQLLINSCYARLLKDLALEAIGRNKEVVEKVRYSVKFIKTSPGREQSFNNLKEQLQVPSTKDLVVDDLAKWNTTYQMLISASEFKEEAFKIHLELMNSVVSEDPFVSSLTKPLLDIFTTYWEGCNMVLAVAVVMDPRFKMKLVEFSFSKLYGQDAEAWIKAVEDGLRELYLEYAVLPLPPPAPSFIEGIDAVAATPLSAVHEDGFLLSNSVGVTDFDIYLSDIMGEQHMGSELDQYLEESLLPRVHEFDVLGWWGENKSRFPTLAKMASDVLSIPLSTAYGESVFDTRGRKLDRNHTSLKDATLQALICAKDWLRQGSSGTPGTFRLF